MKKGLKITSLALVMSMALGCGIVASADEGTEEVPAPAMSKTVKANEDGSYDVEISVKGSVSTETSVKYTQSDVVIIADHSGSMDSYTTSSNSDIRTRWDSLENAVGILADKVLAENTNNRMAFVSFDNYASIMKFGEEYWTSSADEIKGVFDKISYPSGGTYVAEGFDAANDILQTAYDTSAKYVIFLSDGAAFDASESIALSNTLQTTYGTKVYSVGIPYCDEDFMKDMASSEEDYFYAEDADELAKVFDGIADVVNSGYSNVTISDTLSEYVGYLECNTESGNPAIHITGYDAEGNALDEVAYDIDYDTENGKVIISFGEDMIPDQYTYKISYKIKPTEYAEAVYEQNGYNAIGDENTDAEGNTTSSGKDGFAIGESVVSYTYREANYSSNFATPVIQVVEKEESSEESSEPSTPVSEPDSKPESSQPESSVSEGKTGKDAPATGSTQNIIFILAGLAAVSAVISIKAFKTKKSK